MSLLKHIPIFTAQNVASRRLEEREGEEEDDGDSNDEEEEEGKDLMHK